jgi:uncharacterized metal-binding protein
MSSTIAPECARCPIKITDRLCREPDGKFPPFCPTANRPDIVARAVSAYDEPETLRFAHAASAQEGQGYADKELGYARVRPAKSRIQEIIEFSRKMNYTRLGMGFCSGLRKEAAVVEKILTGHGFQVVSAICKVGQIPKERLGIQEEEKIIPGCFESMCNPIAQAYLLNEEKTEFNILLGLCVGHDSLFLKNAEAPCTVLAVKDRLLGHNPLAAIYTAESYYRALNYETTAKR